MIKLVVFDLDGTIADTLADLAASVNQALKKRGLKTYPDEDYKHFVGNGVDNLIRRALADRCTPDLAAEVKEDFSEYYAGHCMDYTTAYPGIADLLKKLNESGVMTAVISNKPDPFVPRIIGTLYPDHRFTYLSGQKPGVPRKPDPTSLLTFIESVGIAKEDTLYVGDSDVDVKYAHAAGVKVCGVSWGFRGAKELREAGADSLADTVEELAEVIDE